MNRSSLLIVTYHALGARASRVVVPPRRLEHDLLALRDAGYAFVSLDQVADWIAGRCPLPARAAAVTFDDGYASIAASALPVLQRLHARATVFVLAGRLGGDNQWPGQPRGVPSMPLLDSAGLRGLAAAGVAIASHSATHARLPGLDDGAARTEVIESADRLEDVLQVPVRHFAYPYGERGPREIELARQRYDTAASADARLVAGGGDPHDLPRIDAHDLHVAVRLRLLDPVRLVPYLAARRALRRLREAASPSPVS